MQLGSRKTTVLFTLVIGTTLGWLNARAQNLTEQDDKYQWLEDVSGERSMAWVNAENERSAKALDVRYDGSHPTLMTPYGGFQVSETPRYSGTVGKLWLERGGILVLSNIRGGAEFGPAWHEAGLKTHRQVIYDDFAAVANDMFPRKITSPRRMGIVGGSNGGLLMGVEFTQHPEMCGTRLSPRSPSSTCSVSNTSPPEPPRSASTAPSRFPRSANSSPTSLPTTNSSPTATTPSRSSSPPRRTTA
jgi:hypothetical protein